jgi:Mg-chelatase subunit ChlD
MKIVKTLLASLTAFSLIAHAEATLPGSATPATAKRPRVEVCFVLDTTGSMSGLIEGAKQKIWSIANDMISAKPTPELKIGLVGYRDRGDDYIVRAYALTDDIDVIYGHLRDFQAGGGGDTQESVNEALDEAINKMKWSADRDVLKIVFLVGDAPPHMDYADGPKYPELCRAAARKDLIINTVQCGDISETTPIWKEIAKLSEGSYAAIAQSGNMAVVTTPMDEKLAELNKRMGETLIPYGDATVRREVLSKQSAAEAAPAAAAADRLSFNVRTKKSVQGVGELVDALANNELKPGDIDPKKLPVELQKLSREELTERIARAQKDRAALQSEVEKVSKDRAAYIAEETKQLVNAGRGDSFDNAVAQIIREQAERKGISY